MPDLEAPVPYDPVRFDLDPEVLLNAMRPDRRPPLVRR